MHPYFTFLPVTSALLCLLLGAFTFYRNTRHLSHIGFALGMASLAIVEVGSALAVYSSTNGVSASGLKLILIGEALLTPAWLLFTGTFAISGCSHRLPGRKLLLVAATGLIALFFSVFSLFYWSPEYSVFTAHTPYEGLSFLTGPFGKLFNAFLIFGMVVNLVQLENTFRSSSGGQRWRIKHLIFGVGSILVLFIYLSAQSLLYSFTPLQMLPVRSVIVMISVCMMAVFIVKYRLFDTDIFISRYFIYNSVTVLAVGIYLLAIGLITHSIRYFNLPHNFFISRLFIFISVLGLIILLSAAVLRRKAQLFINRHFYKHKYEFRDKWMETVEKITPLRSVAGVAETFIDIITETMFPSAIYLWVYDSASKTFVHSGKRGSPRGFEKISREDPFVAVIEDTLAPFSASALKEGPARSIFDKTGAVLCCPLVAGKEVVGFALLGPDRAGARYIQDDNELLKAISTQAAVQIREIRLLEELTATKEIEAFSKMSSFIMHDLKNLTNSLSLVSQNAHENMDNPEFQRDTIKTIDGTVSRMKKVISRLSKMPKDLSLKKMIMDVDELVEKSLMKLTLPADKEISFNKSVAPCPPVLVDPEAFEMVILNLVLNAYEAIGASGEIRLDAFSDGDFVNITVSDNGRGMTEEYLRTSLFRPFKSTKSNGLGIGLYQCKTIIEAHGGTIEVRSSPGAGTGFSIKLPTKFDMTGE